MVTRCRHHRRIVGVRRQHFCHLLKNLIHFFRVFNDELLHVINFTVLLFHQMIYIKPIPLIGRNTSCGSMWLQDITQFLQVCHLVADGRRTQIQICIL